MSMADRDGVIWYDGELVQWRDATTHVLTHTLHYGMGVFEGVRAYDTPQGQAAAYYPETNPLVPLESFGARSHTPTSKFIAIRVLPNTRTTDQQLIASGQ